MYRVCWASAIDAASAAASAAAVAGIPHKPDHSSASQHRH